MAPRGVAEGRDRQRAQGAGIEGRLQLLRIVLLQQQFAQRRVVEQGARGAAGHPAEGQRRQPARAAGANAADIGAVHAVGMELGPQLHQRLGGLQEILCAARRPTPLMAPADVPQITSNGEPTASGAHSRASRAMPRSTPAW